MATQKKGKYTVVMIRHGESNWNKENRFTGWVDSDLSELGTEEAKNSGKWLAERKYTFDVAYTSVLKRAIKTLYYVQEELDLHWIPVIRHWRLNERMYGGLQGLNKSETAAKHGEEQVKIWRRAYATPPPVMEEDHPYNPAKDPKYKYVDPNIIPKTECLKDTVNRALPFWYDAIVPDILAGKKVLIVAHGNSLRALVKYLDEMEDDAIVALNIPTGIPLVYELNEHLKPICHYYVADDETVRKAQEKVAAQGKKK